MVKDRFSTRRFAEILENKLHVFAARFTEGSILLHLWLLVLRYIAIWYQNR